MSCGRSWGSGAQMWLRGGGGRDVRASCGRCRVLGVRWRSAGGRWNWLVKCAVRWEIPWPMI